MERVCGGSADFIDGSAFVSYEFDAVLFAVTIGIFSSGDSSVPGAICSALSMPKYLSISGAIRSEKLSDFAASI